MYREITDVEAEAQGLTADRIVREPDGALTFYCDHSLRMWARREDLHPNPPLPPFYGVV